MGVRWCPVGAGGPLLCFEMPDRFPFFYAWQLQGSEEYHVPRGRFPMSTFGWEEKKLNKVNFKNYLHFSM
jgi:hypothetical protein